MSTIESFDLRAGTILEAKVFAGARKPAYQLWIDFGPELGILKSSAQITVNYDVHELVGKQVIAMVNLAPKQIGNFISQCLVLGCLTDNGGVVLLKPDREVANGARVA